MKLDERGLGFQSELATRGAVCFSSIELIGEHFRSPKPIPLQPAFLRTI